MRRWHARRRQSRVGVARRAGTAAALTAALLGAVSCTGTAKPSSAVAGTAPATTAPAAATPTSSPDVTPAQVPDILRFTGTTLTGTAFDAAQFAGRPVVLWFWAPWCATCASQAWTVAEVAPRYRDTVPIVGIAGLGEQRAMKEFVTEFDLAGMPQIDDRAGALWRRFKVTEQSIFVIIDRDGKVIHQGFLDGEAITARVAALAGA
ncbi:thiol-disulfide isomerase/thioredoxin [Micromonospora luteifusca]|uniref:Thiol-disulfide isomerase/thioredoxin n=1 Tax=Micromonospora luteifusca TaxID=709860 RepID=A0ABS2LPT0_9ACTN|nr:redoxin family protein [Micromonospora luteifusca]MBM7490198.1 thiol-disulfide isomerase/thioredoxin [Micromonospora luteifusca]